MEFYTCIAKYAFFGIRDEKLLATARKSWYHTMVCSGIEAVITGLTRNRVGRFPEWPRKPLILLASSAFLHFFKTEYLRFFYALSTISTPGSQSAGNPQSLENTAWRCIEVVVTRTTRNPSGCFAGCLHITRGNVNFDVLTGFKACLNDAFSNNILTATVPSFKADL